MDTIKLLSVLPKRQLATVSGEREKSSRRGVEEHQTATERGQRLLEKEKNILNKFLEYHYSLYYSIIVSRVYSTAGRFLNRVND